VKCDSILSQGRSAVTVVGGARNKFPNRKVVLLIADTSGYLSRDLAIIENLVFGG